MRKMLAIGFSLLTAACGGLDHVGFFAPKPVEGDGTYVVIYDANGIVPNSALAAANGYCADFAKSAELKSKGGKSYECVSSQLNYCATFVCK
jgi:hypothetical protein